MAKELSPEFYSEVMQWAKGYSTDRIIVLALGDGQRPEEFNSKLIPVAHKEGGVELVVEYLLSNFARPDRTSFSKIFKRLDGGVISEHEAKLIQCENLDDAIAKGYEFNGWELDFSKADNFYHLNPTYFDFNEKEYDIFLHNINQVAAKQMHQWVSIPFKLMKLLTDNQKMAWRDELVPKIIFDHLEFIGNDLFGMNLDSPSKDAADTHIRAATASWDAEIGVLLRNDHDD